MFPLGAGHVARLPGAAAADRVIGQRAPETRGHRTARRGGGRRAHRPKLRL